jgi:hypothetical protein
LVARGGARLSEQLRHDLVAAQREVSGFYAKGVDALSKLSTQPCRRSSRLQLPASIGCQGA